MPQLERRGRLRGAGRSIRYERLVYSWNASGDQAAGWPEDHRHLDARGRRGGRNAGPHGAVRLPAAGRCRLSRHGRRLATHIGQARGSRFEIIATRCRGIYPTFVVHGYLGVASGRMPRSARGRGALSPVLPKRPDCSGGCRAGRRSVGSLRADDDDFRRFRQKCARDDRSCIALAGLLGWRRYPDPPGARMPRQVDYYFSFQSPWAYIGHKSFREVARPTISR